MSLLLETIRIQNKQLQNIDSHNERLNRSRYHLLGSTQEIDLKNHIQIPDHLDNGIFKCRILYAKEIEKIEIIPYQLKPIQSLKMIQADHLHYAYKFADRSGLELLQSKAQLGQQEDIMILKNNYITDTSYANIVFFDGKEWITPATPLLKGTKRSQLLHSQIIREKTIRIQDLAKYQFAKIINAMIDLEESPIISIDAIKMV
jgi:4-amino-4-deoxychorismate lyase